MLLQPCICSARKLNYAASGLTLFTGDLATAQIQHLVYKGECVCVAGGPFNMAEMNKANVHASERVSARDMIQTTFEGDEDLSLMTDKDVAKMKKKAEKDEKAARAALAAHQVCDSFVMTHISTY